MSSSSADFGFKYTVELPKFDNFKAWTKFVIINNEYNYDDALVHLKFVAFDGIYYQFKWRDGQDFAIKKESTSYKDWIEGDCYVVKTKNNRKTFDPIYNTSRRYSL